VRQTLQDTTTAADGGFRRGKLLEYIKGHDNQRNLHSALDYQSPVDFENQNS
jgi:hypothetical protein